MKDIYVAFVVIDSNSRFGNEDYTLTSILNYRKRRIESGCNWFLAQNRPLDWSYEAQLENVPKAYK